VAISVLFRPRGYTAKRHREALKRLQAAGQDKPPGRLHHQALARGETIEMVVDIWQSPTQLQAFATHLMPILGELGVEPSEPEFYDSILLD